MKKLIISTETFPYGKGEKPFILPELEKLVNLYDITIVSHADSETVCDERYTTKLDPRVKVENINLSPNFFSKVWYGLKYWVDFDGWKEIINIFKSKKRVLAKIYQSMGFYILASENFRCMKAKGIIRADESAIYYSFWYYYYTYSMTKNRKKYRNIKIVTRTHGFDLYNERYAGGRQPFKESMTDKIDKIVFISEAGKKYYENVYGKKNSEKYLVNRLGIKETHVNPIELEKKDVFQLVSCSSVIPLKRVEKIIDSLALLYDENVHWIHFGDGSDYEKVRQYAINKLADKKNISFHFMGFWDNEKIIKYYQNNQVDCFITTSSTEGIPVSIQEAMAAGIPIIGTDVGGIAEMIDGNGILLHETPNTEEVCKAICDIYYMKDEERQNLRKRSYEIWKNKFWMEKNVNEFIRILDYL